MTLDGEIVRFMGTHVYSGQAGQLVLAFHVRAVGGVPRAGDDVDAIDVAPPDPTRLREGATSQWLVRQFAEEWARRRNQRESTEDVKRPAVTTPASS